MSFRPRIIFDREPGVLMARFKESVAVGYGAALVYWHQTFVPEHFKRSAAQRYGYQPRQGSGEGPTLQITRTDNRFKPPRVTTRTIRNPHYIWQKQREKGHMDPLVWSGRSKAEAQNNFTITATFNRGVGVFPTLPSYFYKYQKAGQATRDGRVITRTQPDKADELVMFTTSEIEQMARVAETAAANHINGVTQRI